MLIEHPLKIARKSTIGQVNGKWFRLITEVDQNNVISNRLVELSSSEREKADALSLEKW